MGTSIMRSSDYFFFPWAVTSCSLPTFSSVLPSRAMPCPYINSSNLNQNILMLGAPSYFRLSVERKTKNLLQPKFSSLSEAVLWMASLPKVFVFLFIACFWKAYVVEIFRCSYFFVLTSTKQLSIKASCWYSEVPEVVLLLAPYSLTRLRCSKGAINSQCWTFCKQLGSTLHCKAVWLRTLRCWKIQGRGSWMTER